MLALGSVKSIITDSVKSGRIPFDMHGFLTGVVLADLNLSGMFQHSRILGVFSSVFHLCEPWGGILLAAWSWGSFDSALPRDLDSGVSSSESGAASSLVRPCHSPTSAPGLTPTARRGGWRLNGSRGWLLCKL